MNPNNICENGTWETGYFITLDQLVDLCYYVLSQKAGDNQHVEIIKIVEHKLKEMQ